MDVDTQPDRSRDLSRPLDELGPDETLKADSDQLRGTITESLGDEITAAVAADDAKLMKFFGVYQQDDRDIRDERRRQKLEPAYSFMARVRLAITWLRQLINSRQVRTSSEGTCTVGVSPRYSNFASRSASLRSFLFFDRKINRRCPGWATRTRVASGRSRSWKWP